jgi:hypothetical protein
VGQDLVDAFEQANDRIKNLEIFKGKLSHFAQASDLQTERDKLSAGLGGQGIRDRATQIATDRAAIISEIEQRRGVGNLTGQQQYELVARLDKLSQQSPLERINRESIDRQIKIADEAAREHRAYKQRTWLCNLGSAPPETSAT